MRQGLLVLKNRASIPSCSSSEINAVFGLSDVIDQAVALAIYQGLPDLPGFNLLDCALKSLGGEPVDLDHHLAHILYENNGAVHDLWLESHEELLMELIGVLRDDVRRALETNRIQSTDVGIAGWIGREPVLRIKVQWSERSMFSPIAAYAISNTSSSKFGL